MERILLFLNDRDAAKLFHQRLAADYEVRVGTRKALSEPWDLAIVDAARLEKLRGPLRARKQAAAPAILPVLLAAPAAALEKLTPEPWVDEVISLPVSSAELPVRVRNLLRSRRLSREAEGGAALGQASQEWERTFDAVPDLIAILDREHRVVRCNRAMAAALGLTPEQLVGRTCYEAVHGLAEPPDFCPHSRLLREEREQIAEVEELGRHFLVTASPLSDEQGRVVGSVHVARDITGRKEAEDEKRAAAERVQAVLASVTDGVIGLSFDWRYTYVNEAGARMLRRQPEDLVGVPLFQAFPEARGSIFEEKFRQALEERVVTRFEAYYPPLEAWFDCRCYPSPEGISIFFTDTTERKQIAEAIRKSEERLRIAQQAARIGTFEWNLQTGINSWTPELELMYGLPPGSFPQTQQAWEDLLYPADRAEAVRRVERALETGEPTEGEWRVVWPDGSVRWLAGRWQVIKDDAGHPLRMTGINIDITERKQAEEALAQSEAQERALAGELRAVLDTVPMPIFLAQGPDGRYITGNPAAYELLCLPPGSNLSKAAPAGEQPPFKAIKDGREMAVRELPVQQAVAGRVVRDLEYDLVLADGTTRHVSANAVPLLDDAGKARGAVAALIDLTGRKRAEDALRASEERFRTMANTIPQLAWIAKLDGYISWYNQRWYEYTGTTPADMEGWGWQSVHDPEVLPRVMEQWQASLATGQPFNMVFPLRGADGQFRPFLTRVLPLKDKNGKVVQWFGTNTDISEHLQAETALRLSHQRLDLLAETTARLLASVSPQEVVDAICQKVMTFLDCDAFFNFLVDEKEGRLHLNAWAGIPAEEARRIEWLDYGEAVCGCAARDGQRIVAEDILNMVDTRTELVKSFGIQAYACHPLQVEGRVLGTLSFGTRNRPHFTAEDLDLMKAVADQVAIAMDRKLAEEALQESQRDLNRAQTVSHTGSWRLDVGRNELLWSEETYRIFGIPQGTPLTYETFIAMVHPEDRDYVDQEWTAALRGEPYDVEHRINTDGTVKWVRERAELEFDPQGRLRGGFGTTQDITERRRAEEKLRYVSTFPHLNPNPVLEVDTSGEVTFYNPAVLKELERLDAPQDAKEFLPADLAEIIQSFRDAKETKCYREIQVGKAIFAINFYWTPQFNTVRIFGMDITEHKRAEEANRRQAELLDLAHDAILVRDLKDRIVFWNRGAAETYGFSREEALGQDAHHLLKTAFPQPIKEIEEELVKAGRWDGEMVHYTKDGRRLVMTSSWTLHRDAPGNPARILEICSDITARKEAEIRVGRQNTLLAGINRVLQEALSAESEEALGRTCLAVAEALTGSKFGFIATLNQRGLLDTIAISDPGWEACKMASSPDLVQIKNMRVHGIYGKCLQEEMPEIVNAPLRHPDRVGTPPGHPPITAFLGVPLFQGDKTVGMIGLGNKTGGYNLDDQEAVETLAVAVAEAFQHKRAQEALRQAHADLERRVEERTADLKQTVEQLEWEINERKLAQDALRASEERFVQFMRHLPGAALMRDARGRYLFANEMWEQVFGKTQPEWLGKTLEEVWSPDYAARYRALDQEVIQEGRALQSIETYQTPEGERVFLATRFPILDQSGQPLMVGAVGIDITERQRAEAALKEQTRLLDAFFEHALTPQVFLDKDFNFIRVNRAYAQSCQRPAEDFTGRNHFELYPNAENQAIFEAVVRTREPYEAQARAFEFPDHPEWGVTYWDWSLTPILGERGEVDFLVFSLKDVTARHRAEEALRESEKKLRFLAAQILQVQEQERQRLSRELHDGLGQVLLVFKLQLRAVQRQLPETEDWRSLRQDCTYALQIIDGIIEDIRRLSHNLSPTVLEDIGLTAAIRSLCEEFQRVHGLEFILDLDELGRPLNNEFKINLYRICQEALANISKYANASRVKLSIKKQGSGVAFIIEDDGAGFDVGAAMSRETGVPGMGLAAMFERVRTLGGTLEVASRPGTGTRISFTIPGRSLKPDGR